MKVKDEQGDLRDTADYNMSAEQLEILKDECPNCGGQNYPVSGTENDEGEIIEDYLWCNGCDISIDSSGGYIC